MTPTSPAPEQLLKLTVKPLNINLLGLEVKSDPIVVNILTQGGDGKLLGNLLGGIRTLINVDGVNAALNNVLSATVDIVNSARLEVLGVGSGAFDNAEEKITPVLDVFVAPVRLDLLGLVAVTDPIHLTVTAQSGQGRVLGNVVTELANLFNPPLPDRLDLDFVNIKLADLLRRLNEQIPGINPAPLPSVKLGAGQFLAVTLPPLDLNLLGLLVKTSPITGNATSHTGGGLLLGNLLTTALNTLGANPQNLTGINNNLNAILAKVFGVLNASRLVLSGDVLGTLPNVLQTLAQPTLISSTAGSRAQILNLVISAGAKSAPPVDVNLLGLQVTTSDIDADIIAETGEGKILGNLLYNVSNLLNPDGLTSLLFLLSQVSKLSL